MKLANFILVILLSVVAAAVTATGLRGSPEKSAAGNNPYDTLLRSHVLHCGYEYWDGGLMQDKETHRMTGAMAEITEALAKSAGLTVDWTAEVGWGTEASALKAGKVDAICAGIWQSADKAKELNFTMPVAYQAVQAFVRSDNPFNGDLAALNKPEVTLAVVDGDNSDFIAQQDFPAAKRFALGQLNGTDAELMMSVMNNKGDATFTIPGLWREFDKSNPGKLKPLSPQALRVFGLAYATDNADPRLQNLLNTAIQENVNSGAIDKILDKYNTAYPEMFIKPAKPFLPQN